MSKCSKCGHDNGGKDSRNQKLLMVAWGVLLVPTILWWREAVWWIVFMSWYANFVGHWSARKGAQAKESNDDG